MDAVTMREGCRLRPAALEDLDTIVELIDAHVMKVIGRGDESAADVREEWALAGYNLETDTRVVAAPDGRIVGYGKVMDVIRPMTPFVGIHIHPDCWGQGLDAELMRWAEERANAAMSNPKLPADARVLMQAEAYSTDSGYKGLLERAGMEIVRRIWQMQIDFDSVPPAPQWPDGITVRTVAPGEDLRPLLGVFRESWKDHWGYVDTPFEEHYARWLQYYWDDPEFDPSLWFVAMDGDRAVGFSMCRWLHGGDHDLGWVQTLAVMREYRKQGLGMALLRHSFSELYKRGKKRVGLGVDASNLSGATRLYERAGMHIVLQMEVYEKELRPGIDYRTGV